MRGDNLEALNEELNKVLDEYAKSREGIDSHSEIATVVDSVKAGFERDKHQRQFSGNVAKAISHTLHSHLHGVVDSVDICDIAKDVQRGLYKVFAGTEESPGYHVIPQTGNSDYEKVDLAPGLMANLFGEINN